MNMISSSFKTETDKMGGTNLNEDKTFGSSGSQERTSTRNR